MAIPESASKTASPPRFNVDFLAVAIALTLATLIRFNILPQIRW